VTSHLGVLGNHDEEFAGRCWVRRFEGGQFEVLYRSGQGPSEAERFNQWLADGGIDNRVGTLRTGWVETRERPEVEDAPESNRERAMRRARQQLRWKIKAIGVDHMITLTTRENITDKARSTAQFRKFIARCRKEWPTFRYVAVPEEQKRGAWHWHMAVCGWQNYDKLRGFWWASLGYKVQWSEGGKPILREHPDDPSSSPGNVDGIKAKHRGKTRRVWDAARLSGYLSKYLGKTIGQDGAHVADGQEASYSCSRGIRWAVERYAVRAQSFASVGAVVLSQVAPSRAADLYAWQDPSRTVLWFSGVDLGPQGPVQ
jgi:hypothetical protein